MTYIPDPIEIGESRMERWADENLRGDEFQCGCGKWVPLDQGIMVSPNPWCEPVCEECATGTAPTVEGSL